jgi:enoyl-CoA hydratase
LNYDHYQRLELALADGILTITLNRPESVNAIDEVMHEELSRIFYDLALDDQVKVAVLTGAAGAFCAGGDISWMKTLLDPAAFERAAVEGRRIVFGMLDCPTPIVAKVNGAAIGLGATIALFSDIIIAADTAKFADPHVRVGLVAGDGGAIIWPQLIGFARAKEYLMTGNAIAATEAQRIGLINHAVPAAELDAKVDVLCRQLTGGATRAISWTKILVNVALKQLAHTILDASFAFEALSNFTEDHRRAVAAFAEKRPPAFVGR